MPLRMGILLSVNMTEDSVHSTLEDTRLKFPPAGVGQASSVPDLNTTTRGKRKAGGGFCCCCHMEYF